MNTFSVAGKVMSSLEEKKFDSGAILYTCRLGYRQRKETVYLQLDFWAGKHNEKALQYIQKDKQVFVSGELMTREYKDKTYLSIDVSNFEFLNTNGNGNGKQKTAATESKPVSDADFSEVIQDDIPF